MAEIKVKEGESLDSALRRFKRAMARSGVLTELRKREHYEKPSVKRKKKVCLNCWYWRQFAMAVHMAMSFLPI